MVLNAFLSGDGNTKIAEARLLYITNKTVRFGDDVYQFRNVTGFGIGEVKLKKIPFLIIVIFFLFGAFLISRPSLNSGGLILSLQLFGVILMGTSIGGIIYNNTQSQMYGLKLYVNSGDAQIFITSNTDWLKRAVGTLYDFLENAEEGSSMTIQVGGNISGNIVHGSTVRDVKNVISE